MKFAEIEKHWNPDWSYLVMLELKKLLPNVDWSDVYCNVSEAPGANRPLQKYLYMKHGDRPAVLIKSFRYFDELDSDEAWLAKVMLLVG